MSARMMAAPVFDHLLRLSDGLGIFEHALLSTPRPEHGYCVDDVARGLVVACREPDRPAAVTGLIPRYLEFVLSAIAPEGTCRNRMDVAGGWRDEPGLGDWWGRALWALGTATAYAPSPGMRARAIIGFRTAAGQRSPHLRSMVYASLGAAEVLEVRPDEPCARSLLRDTVRMVGPAGPVRSWPWPEERLTYGNASIAEALILAGIALPDAHALDRGLELLDFLLRLESRPGHLSLTPVGGRGRDESGPGFDQQPIEAAALADACATAYEATDDPAWLDGVHLAWRWFTGENDSSTPMFDPDTGGGYDGLERYGCNLNQGAESTLALLSTAQQVRRLP
ncbi:glycosyltransferase [Actinocorallia longicatena]|uniref:Glycosyl transferase n=1 Tax=Actinocorallia longicatena TaxID=111803 RepID=A0ABP6QNH1_9ACTN